MSNFNSVIHIFEIQKISHFEFLFQQKQIVDHLSFLGDLHINDMNKSESCAVICISRKLVISKNDKLNRILHDNYKKMDFLNNANKLGLYCEIKKRHTFENIKQPDNYKG